MPRKVKSGISWTRSRLYTPSQRTAPLPPHDSRTAVPVQYRDRTHRNPQSRAAKIANRAHVHRRTAAQSTEIIAYWRICNFSRTVLLRLSWSCTEILTHSVTSQFARPRIARHTSDRSLLRFAHHAPLLSVPRCYLPPTPPSTGGGTRSLRTTQHSHGIVDLQPMPPPLEFHTP